MMTRRTFVLVGAGTALGAACSSSTPSAAPTSSEMVEPDTTSVSANATDSARLTGWLVTRWATDPFSLGSYSYLAVGATPADREALQVPVGGRLVLAGEHTSTRSPATTHGALESGRRAAAQIRSLGVDGTVIVVGAGFAGLGAARALADAGVEVVVLEGRDRLGGRAFTNTDLDTPVDLGASWIHGIVDNPMAELAQQIGARWSIENGDDNIAFDSAGAPLSEAEASTIEALAVDVVDTATAAAAALGADVDHATMVRRELDRRQLDQRTSALVEVEIRRLVEHEYAADLDQLSTWNGDEGDPINGDEVVLPEGYVHIVEHLATGLDVRLDTKVTAISVADDGVTVSTADGAVQGALVIVTLPLGVLQAGAVSFDPPLPDQHLAAIERLGMGVLDKVVLQFDRPVWPTDVDFIGLDRADGRFIEWLNLTKHTGQAVLVGFTAGRPARDQEEVDDTTLIDDALSALRTAFPGIAPRG